MAGGVETGETDGNKTALGGCLGNQRIKYLQQKSKVYTPDYRPCNLWKYYFFAADEKYASWCYTWDGLGMVCYIGAGIEQLVVLNAGFFLLLAIALGFQTSTVKEVMIDYTECEVDKVCVKDLDTDSEETNTFPIEGPILIYYYIENFHQNHRGYEDDRDDNQLAGTTLEGKSCSSNTSSPSSVLPCGFAANTMFTDKIQWINDRNGKPQVNGTKGMKDPELKKDLSYSMESDAYSPPSNESLNVNNKLTNPEDWTDDMWRQYKDNDPSFLEDFRVWMRLAPLPKFRKLWYRMGDLMPRLENGKIKIEVNWPKNDNSNLKIPNLRKKVILTQQSFFGAKSYTKCGISGVLFTLFSICGFFLWHLAGEDQKYDAKKEKVEESKQKKR